MNSNMRSVCVLFLFLGFVQFSIANWYEACTDAVKDSTMDPVCYNGEKTFENMKSMECYLKYMFEDEKNITQGPCEGNPDFDPCLLKDAYYSELCGSDNGTYNNKWHAKCVANQNGVEINIVGEGACNGTCASSSVRYEPVCTSLGRSFPNKEAVECYNIQHPYEKAELKENEFCYDMGREDCIAEYWRYQRDRPVCASNGFSYGSSETVRCLRKYGRDIEILHEGQCTFEDVKRLIPEGQLCYLAQNSIMGDFICADGANYTNIYDFACKASNDPELAEKEYNLCSGSSNSVCSTDVSDFDTPMCASNRVTYKSWDKFMCDNKDGRLFIIDYSECSDQNTACKVYESNALQRQFAEPVCGSDGVTYVSPTALACQAESNSDLERKHYGKCF